MLLIKPSFSFFQYNVIIFSKGYESCQDSR